MLRTVTLDNDENHDKRQIDKINIRDAETEFKEEVELMEIEDKFLEL